MSAVEDFDRREKALRQAREAERAECKRWDAYFQKHPMVLEMLGALTRVATAPGGGGSVQPERKPLHVIAGANPHEVTPPTPDPGYGLFWVKYGTVNGFVPAGIDASIVCSLTGSWDVWADCTLNESTVNMIDGVVFTVRDAFSAPTQDPIGLDGTLPAMAYVLLARIVDGAVENAGAGSLFLGPQVKRLALDGTILFHLAWVRS